MFRGLVLEYLESPCIRSGQTKGRIEAKLVGRVGIHLSWRGRRSIRDAHIGARSVDPTGGVSLEII